MNKLEEAIKLINEGGVSFEKALQQVNNQRQRGEVLLISKRHLSDLFKWATDSASQEFQETLDRQFFDVVKESTRKLLLEQEEKERELATLTYPDLSNV